MSSHSPLSALSPFRTFSVLLLLTLVPSFQWENRLLVGTDDGSLMILEEQSASHLTEFAVLDTRKGFTKRGIAQLQVCEELGSIISLTSDGIQVNRLNHTMDMTAQLIKTRGSHLFAISADISPPVLCCASKKKLLLYRFSFSSSSFLLLPSSPSSILLPYPFSSPASPLLLSSR